MITMPAQPSCPAPVGDPVRQPPAQRDSGESVLPDHSQAV